MPSGDPYAWTCLEPVLQSIAAKVDPETGQPLNPIHRVCQHGDPCAYIGPLGAGHYVKMVNNGIEYADMQLICEAYQIMREGLGLDTSEIALFSASGTKAR